MTPLPERAFEGSMSADEEQPTLSQAGYQNVSPGFGATKSNVCANCGAQLQADQHYCVECGARRGQARFKLADMPSAKSSTPASAATAAHGASSSRWSAGLGLVSVIAVLLLAVGVGVLIGHQGGSGTASNGTQKIVVSGTGSGSSGTGATDGSATTASSAGNSTAGSASTGQSSAGKSGSGTKAASTSSSSKKTTKVVIKQPTKKELSAVQKAQGQSFSGTNGTQRKLASPTQKEGGSCTNGTAGCSNGKFTGSFFGGS